MTDKLVVLVTCSTRGEAARIGRALVEHRLAACATILPAPAQSIYRWKGKIEVANEFLLIIKTSGKRFTAIEKVVRRMHSYDVPEIIALHIAKGSRPYLAWISESLRETKS